jgi:hypothetical protein
MDNPVDGGHSHSRRAGVVEHLCRHPGCGRWGGWGYDGGGGVSAWWCLDHRPNINPPEPVAQQGGWVSDGNEG